MVTVIGGANIDIVGTPSKKLIPEDSNPGRINLSYGGVGRNIAENLVKLGINTKLITALSNDHFGKRLLNHCLSVGIDMKDSLLSFDYKTSIYMSVNNAEGDIYVAVSDMDILKIINKRRIEDKKNVISESKIVVLDTNLEKESIEFIIEDNPNQLFFIDLVSTTKSKKIKELKGKFHTIKSNKIEAEILTGVKITDEESMDKAANQFIESGVKQIFITLSEDGVYYSNGEIKGLIPGIETEVINASGAGDAFLASLVYAYLNKMKIKQAAKFAFASSIITLSHNDAINSNISVEKITEKITELGL